MSEAPARPDPGAPAPAATIEVVHETVYTYVQPVAQSHHIAHLKPMADEGQTLLASDLVIQPAPSARHERVDSFGNASLHLAIGQPHRSLCVRAFSRVCVRPRFARLDPAASPRWEGLRDRLRYVARAPFDPAVEFVQPSPYVPRLDALRAYAVRSFSPGRPAAEAAVDLMRRIHADFEYRSSSTDVDTPVEQAFAQRLGVCQDFAHVMIGACRMLGLPARYVSGYLLTRTAPGEPALVGADASHAWVQVYVPGTPGVPRDGWLDLDPTNDLVPGLEHVRLAVGRDFGDVTPLRGVIRGGGEHTLAVGVTTRRMPDPVRPGPDVA